MPLLIDSFAEWKQLKKSFVGKKIGFVPTMGHLHQGHLSLCAKSQSENDITVVSIFVNPTQFNDAQDLALYPRTLEADMALLEQQGVDYCLVPDANELYADNYHYQISETTLSQTLEGPLRPGHFTGVLTIVMKLLLGVGCQKAYFGEKDFQQYQLISGMAKSFLMDCEIVLCPSIRELGGLPFSSRNSRLSVEERALANKFSAIFLQKQLSLDEIQRKLEEENIRIDYLTEVDNRRFVAVRIGPIRILDNYDING